jgi:hypothetical protein
MFRGPARRAIRRGIRRERRWLRRRARRIVRGAWVLLMLAGTATAIKISTADAVRIEAAYHKPPESMNETELNAACQKLNIKKQDLDEEDEGHVDTADEQDEKAGGGPAPATGGAKFCSGCGAPLKADAKFCEKCGKKL